jgi:hypothetical protein
MADAKSDYLERKSLDHNLGTATFTKPTAVYASLHTTSPLDAATGAEVSGGSYARQAVTFTAAATNTGVTSASNTANVSFLSMPTATVSHVGIYDAATGGNLLYHAALAASKSLTSGDNFTINAGQLVVQEN